MASKEQGEASSAKDSLKTIVLIGSQGSGKSSTGNSLLGKNKFVIGVGPKSTTTEMKREEESFGGRDVTIIDTKGLQKPSDVNYILNNLTIEEKLNVVFAINIAIGRYLIEERDVITSLLKYYRGLLKYVIIIFTRADELKGYPRNADEVPEEDRSSDEFAKEKRNAIDKWLEAVPSLKDLIKTYSIEYVALENDNRHPSSKWSEINDHILRMQPLEHTTCIEKCWRIYYNWTNN